MTALPPQSLPNNDDKVLDFSDSLIDLEFALLRQKIFTLRLPFGEVVLEPMQQDGQFLLALKSFKGHADQSQEAFFSNLLNALESLVEGLNDYLALDKDVALVISGADILSYV